MRRAVELAARGLGRTSPNPVVGAVVLDPDGEPAGEGWHQQAGTPHAEAVALAAAGSRARGGTVVVTLEPCAHTGRTGPCSELLHDAGVARVVYAVADPDPIAGGGAARLREYGVDVVGGVLASAAERVNEAWLHAVRHGRPFVTVKYGATLDGRVAAPDGSSKWITGPDARIDVHRLRDTCDAVMVGVGTVLADDPRLTVRDDDGRDTAHQPLRVVVDTHGRTPPQAQVRAGAAPTLVLTRAQVHTSAGRLDPWAILRVLHERGIRSVLLEGGPTLVGSFVDAGLVDRVIAYLAPALLGGVARSAVGGRGAPTISEAWRLHLDDVTTLGGDIRVTARPLKGS